MYVPTYNSGNCAYVYDGNFIRVYDTRPTSGSTIHYIDYNYNAHYISREGSTTFTNYTNLPSCTTDLTDNYFKRTDITDILICFTIFIGFNYLLISKLVKALLRGGRIW